MPPLRCRPEGAVKLGGSCSPYRNLLFLFPLIKLARSADYCVRPLITTCPSFHSLLIFMLLKKEEKRAISRQHAMQELQFAEG